MDHYEEVNTAWPETLPPCTREEAARAAVLLMRKFAGKRVKYSRYAKVRRCWIALTPPYTDIRRGWRRLVHDVSHRAYRLTYKRGVFNAHGRTHAAYELGMIQHVLNSGWLDGKLRSEKPPRQDASIKAERVAARIITWERKLGRAERALKKLRRQQAYYQRKVAV